MKRATQYQFAMVWLIKVPPKARVVKGEVFKRGGLVRRLQDPHMHTQRGL